MAQKIAKLIIMINDTDITADYTPEQVAYFVAGVLSKGNSVRFHENWGELNLMGVFKAITADLNSNDVMTVSTGSYTRRLSIENWQGLLTAMFTYNIPFPNDGWTFKVQVNGKAQVSERPDFQSA